MNSYGDEESEADSHDSLDFAESLSDDSEFDVADKDPYGLGMALQRI